MRAGLRAGLYIRTSAARRPFEPSVAEQRRQLRAYAAASGLRVVGEFVDEATAADAGPPPQRQWLLAAAALGGLDVVLACAPDHLAPETDELVELVARLARHGVDVAYPWTLR